MTRLAPVFTFHLARTSLTTTMRAVVAGPNAARTPGLRHAECMTAMTLGAPIVSPQRLQARNLAMFASWEDESAIDAFLASDGLGRELAAGWHVRMAFIRRWGLISEFDGLPTSVGEQDPDAPVVAVTLARLKLPQIPRFIRWGKPVERQVRDNPHTTIALAAGRPPRTVSTFSVWETQRAMTDMVRGRGDEPHVERHVAAMAERNDKDFHFEFTTLRFRPISEHGSFAGRSNIIPTAAT